MPNIGKTLENRLIDAGIESAEQLRELGSRNAFLRMQVDDPGACYNMLCALEGACQGIRWHGLPPEDKQELKAFLDQSRR